MKTKKTNHKVLEAVIDERNEMRDDHTNVKVKINKHQRRSWTREQLLAELEKFKEKGTFKEKET